MQLHATEQTVMGGGAIHLLKFKNQCFFKYLFDAEKLVKSYKSICTDTDTENYTSPKGNSVFTVH